MLKTTGPQTLANPFPPCSSNRASFQWLCLSAELSLWPCLAWELRGDFCLICISNPWPVLGVEPIPCWPEKPSQSHLLGLTSSPLQSGSLVREFKKPWSPSHSCTLALSDQKLNWHRCLIWENLVGSVWLVVIRFHFFRFKYICSSFGFDLFT